MTFDIRLSEANFFVPYTIIEIRPLGSFDTNYLWCDFPNPLSFEYNLLFKFLDCLLRA